MRKRIYIFVPGILNWPGSAEGWTDRAVTWVHTRTPYRAEKFEYFNGPWGAVATVEKRAAALARLLQEYHDEEKWELVLVGHSNGCEVIVRALRSIERDISSVFMMAPACSADLESTELPERLKNNNLYKLIVGIGGRDLALQRAKRFSWVMRLFGLHYGTLGAENPEDLMTQLEHPRFRIAYMPTFNHNDWVRQGINFELTMRGIQRETV